MSRQSGYNTALQQSLTRLEQVDWSRRCGNLGLPAPADGRILFRALGMDLMLELAPLTLRQLPDQQPLKISDQILIFHYLGCEFPVTPTGQFIPFRELPGGRFYEGPFRARSVGLLVQKIQNDLRQLEKNLEYFGGVPENRGDFCRRFPVIGNLETKLIYYTGDAEFAPEANLLFDQCIQRVFPTEDVAVLANRVCLVAAGIHR